MRISKAIQELEDFKQKELLNDELDEPENLFPPSVSQDLHLLYSDLLFNQQFGIGQFKLDLENLKILEKEKIAPLLPPIKNNKNPVLKTIAPITNSKSGSS